MDHILNYLRMMIYDYIVTHGSSLEGISPGCAAKPESVGGPSV